MYTIVVVDDEPIIRMDLIEALREKGYDLVGQGSDGFDAIEQCRQHKPDVLLLDIKMPVFDGISVAETIVKEELAGCIIFITAYADSKFIEKAKLIGATGYLVKPLNEQTLFTTIEISIAQSNRFKSVVNEKKEAKKKLEENKLLDRAKLIISKRDNIPEGEAYKLIQKMSMDKQCSMAQIAKLIVENYSGREIVEKTKTRIIKNNNVDEKKAYNIIKCYSKEQSCSLTDAAIRINRMDDRMLLSLTRR